MLRRRTLAALPIFAADFPVPVFGLERMNVESSLNWRLIGNEMKSKYDFSSPFLEPFQRKSFWIRLPTRDGSIPTPGNCNRSFFPYLAK